MFIGLVGHDRRLRMGCDGLGMCLDRLRLCGWTVGTWLGEAGSPGPQPFYTAKLTLLHFHLLLLVRCHS